jgi:endonuclease/exonuclease/phosphatase family metal-dependent hydrolase
MAGGTPSATVAGIIVRKTLLLLPLIAPALAVEIRVATFNVGAQFTESSGGIFYPEFGLGAAGTPDHESVKAVLDRINADVVALQEIDSADTAGTPNDVDDLAASLGYPYVYIAPNNGNASLVAPFDSDLRVAILSRFPFHTATAIRSPVGAKELTRLHAAVHVDVPGTTQDPWILNAHLKPGGTTDERFRRAVEMKRMVGHLTTLGLTADDNYILTGDFNLNPNYASTTFNSLPSGLPGTYDLGDDYPLPISYSINPLAYFTTPGAARLDPRQLNGSAVTFSGGAGYTLDLFLVSPALAGRPNDSEIYNSTLDTSNGAGLPKAGSPLPAGTSAAASDHYAVFVDLELDSDLPNLALALSAAAVDEGLPDGTVMATATLPATRPGAVTVTLSSDDPGAVPVAPTILIPAGSLAGSVALRAPRNFIADPPRSVTFTATASGYDPDVAVLLVNDADGPYVFTAAGQTVTESFSGFTGTHDPAPWATTGGLPWHGIDSGTSSAAGLRAYGSAADPSLGFLPAGTGKVATATFVNDSPVILTALEIAFDIEQWRSSLNGSADGMSAELFHNGQTIPLPELSHDASQSLPNGAVAGGLTTAKNTVAAGLSIPPGDSFELRVHFTPGPGGGVQPADVFLNEIHYDNIGTDENEFIEIAVAPGFTGTAADIEVIPYNGSTSTAAVPYSIPGFGSAIPLSSFTEGQTSNGYRLFSLTTPTDGIQNGGNDGFAIVDTRNGQVLQLVSYEGTFTAAAGSPAAGLTSVSIGLSQNNTTTQADSSLGLTGSGGMAGDFTWASSQASNTKGTPNTGQTFVPPVPPPQGLALDNLSVTFLADPDSDGDGLADSLDPDDDNDGQSDADELAFGTDPLDEGSVFRPVLTRASGLELTFPGAAGITYTVEFSTDLVEWDELSVHPGNGQAVVVPLPGSETATFFRVRAGE